MDDRIDVSTLRYEIEPPVAVLTLNRPDRRNALNDALIGELAEGIRQAVKDTRVGAIVLTGAGSAFCAGLDLGDLERDALDLSQIGDPETSPWALLQSSPKPTIAAVNGPAVTGGLELVLSTDLALAGPGAWFQDTHSRVGLHPGGGLTVLLPRIVGLRRALTMSATSDVISAVSAWELGLVTEVVDGDVVERACAVARSCADVDPEVWPWMRTSYIQNAGDGVVAMAVEREVFMRMAVGSDRDG